MRTPLFLRLGCIGLVVALLLSSHSLCAQSTKAYWRNADSLGRVLASQHTDTDTARLRALRHLVDLVFVANLPELVRLTGQLHTPDHRAYRQWQAAYSLMSGPVPQAAALDSLQAAITEFDRLGRPAFAPLIELRTVYNILHQQKAKQAYYQAKLTDYRQRGEILSMAACYHALGGYYSYQGDQNLAISYYFRAAELFRPLTPDWYDNEVSVIGAAYREWGNYDRALPFLQQALANAATTKPIDYDVLIPTTRAIAEVYLHQRRYPLSLRYADRSLAFPIDSIATPATNKACGLVLKSAALLALGRITEAGRLLPLAQHLADSLHLTVNDVYGYVELDAAWARYYMARHEPARAEAAWLAAYHQAQTTHTTRLRLSYLRELGRFYQQQGRLARAAPYALAAATLADSLETTQAMLYVSQYETAQADRAQQASDARLRLAQVQAAAQTRHQRLLLAWALAVLALVLCLGYVLWRSNRRQRQANTLLTKQKTQIQEQATRLGELDTAKNQFFANVSHELRTPLTLILGPLGTLLSAPPRPLPGVVREPLALAYRHAQRLHELVNRILDLTKLEAGRLELHPVPTALAPLLRRVVAHFESLAAERRVALVAPTTLPPEELYVALDADKLEQILNNLLANALRHTPAGGAVTVSLAPPGPAGQYALTVRDTGPGIAAAEQARVFERYYQSPHGPTQGGTGLGLALSRELATLLGGSLTLASEPGQGAAFTLSFPAPPVATPAETRAPKALPTTAQHSLSVLPLPDPAGPRPRVLVVEDQADLREYLRQLLASTCEVLTAEDGQAALELLARETAVDLITTDAMMPRLTGTELLAQLRAAPAWQGVPVLMLTARADEAHRLAALTVGVDDYLTKPFAPDELLVRVHTLLARQQVRRHFAALPPEQEPALADRAADLPDEPLPSPATEPVAPVARRPARPGAQNEQLTHWQTLVQPHLAGEEFGPSQLAELLCLSERTLYRRLGELTGLTPAAWLRELRLNQARRLLEAGSVRSVVAVAEAVGFASAKYFIKLYTERFGRHPADY